MIEILGGFVLAGIAASISGGVKDYVQDWVAFGQTGEYNLDDDITTPDFCMMRDPANGNWGLVMITRYERPYIPGGGGVEFWTFDSAMNTKRRHFWPLREWREARTDRCNIEEFISSREHELLDMIDKTLTV